MGFDHAAAAPIAPKGEKFREKCLRKNDGIAPFAAAGRGGDGGRVFKEKGNEFADRCLRQQRLIRHEEHEGIRIGKAAKTEGNGQTDAILRGRVVNGDEAFCLCGGEDLFIMGNDGDGVKGFPCGGSEGAAVKGLAAEGGEELVLPAETGGCACRHHHTADLHLQHPEAVRCTYRPPPERMSLPFSTACSPFKITCFTSPLRASPAKGELSVLWAVFVSVMTLSGRGSYTTRSAAIPGQ